MAWLIIRKRCERKSVSSFDIPSTWIFYKWLKIHLILWLGCSYLWRKPWFNWMKKEEPRCCFVSPRQWAFLLGVLSDPQLELLVKAILIDNYQIQFLHSFHILKMFTNSLVPNTSTHLFKYIHCLSVFHFCAILAQLCFCKVLPNSFIGFLLFGCTTQT